MAMMFVGGLLHFSTSETFYWQGMIISDPDIVGGFIGVIGIILFGWSLIRLGD